MTDLITYLLRLAIAAWILAATIGAFHSQLLRVRVYRKLYYKTRDSYRARLRFKEMM